MDDAHARPGRGDPVRDARAGSRPRHRGGVRRVDRRCARSRSTSCAVPTRSGTAGSRCGASGDAFRIYTRDELADAVGHFANRSKVGRLSRPALETLSIVAYRQPVTRGEIARIRGVNVDSVLQTLDGARPRAARSDATPGPDARRCTARHRCSSRRSASARSPSFRRSRRSRPMRRSPPTSSARSRRAAGDVDGSQEDARRRAVGRGGVSPEQPRRRATAEGTRTRGLRLPSRV